MRIHTDNISSASLYDAAWKADVTIEHLSSHGSRKRDHAFEVALGGSSRYNGASSSVEWPYKAATWDEWGLFIAALFKLERTAVIGYYDGVADFLAKTRSEVERVQRYHPDGFNKRTHRGPWLHDSRLLLIAA